MPEDTPHVPETFKIPVPPGWEGPCDGSSIEFRMNGQLGVPISHAIYHQGNIDDADVRDFDIGPSRPRRIRIRIWVSICVFSYAVIILI